MYPYDAENGEMHRKSDSKLQVSGTSSESCCPGIFFAGNRSQCIFAQITTHRKHILLSYQKTNKGNERRKKNMKRNEIFVGNLCLEVTRRCNMGCAHCLRGNAEDLDMSRETIDQVLEQVDMIGQVTFTGGEPSLNTDAIRYFFAQARKYGKLPRSFFVATNGKANQEELAIELLKQYPDMEEQEFCGVALSIDEWHDPQDYGQSILRGLSFYNDCKEKPDGYSLIPEGRAAKLTIDPKKMIQPTSAHIVLSGNSDPDAGLLEVETLYVAADGKIVGNCDMSYARIEKEAEYTISGFRAAVDKLVSELG